MSEIVNICVRRKVRTMYRIRVNVVAELYERDVAIKRGACDLLEAVAAVSLRFQKVFTIMRGILNGRT